MLYESEREKERKTIPTKRLVTLSGRRSWKKKLATSTWTEGTRDAYPKPIKAESGTRKDAVVGIKRAFTILGSTSRRNF